MQDDAAKAALRVFREQQRRETNSITSLLFPRSIVFGCMGDASNDRSFCEQEVIVLRFLGDDGQLFNTFVPRRSI